MTAKPFHIHHGERASRWLVTCDHATNRVPPDVGGGSLGIAPADMERHIAYDVGAAGLARHLAEQVGQTHRILMESPRLGRTEQFTEVAFATDQPEGQIVTARITGHDGERLIVG